MRIVLLVVLTTFSATCVLHPDERSKIPIARHEPARPYPRTPIVSPETDLIREAENYDALFALERVVKLEQRANVILGYIGRVRYHRDKFVIFDAREKLVHVYEDNGRYLRVIGRSGQGPGEYTQPGDIHIVDGQIAVVDEQESEILFYDVAGRFLRKIRPDHTTLRIFIHDLVIFRGTELYVCDVPASRQQTPKHLVLDTTKDPAQPIFGFGERLPFYFSRLGRRMPRFGTEIFEEINGTIWTIPGYQTDIEVFDFNGHQLGSLPSGVDGITPEIVSQTKNQADAAATVQMVRPYHLLHHGNFVVLRFYGHDAVTIFDIHGNLVRKGLPMDKVAFRAAIALENGVLISRIDTMADPRTIEASNGTEILQAFIEAGYDPDDFEGDNPYLILHRPEW